MKIKKNIALSDSGFIFNPSTGESFIANPIGLEIINLLKEGKKKEQIEQFVLEKYQTDEETFERDYYDFENILNHYQIAEINEEKEN